MAKASFKRIESSNKILLSKLKYIIGIPALIYGTTILISKGNITLSLKFLYFATLSISLILCSRLYSMGGNRQVKGVNEMITHCGVDLESSRGIHQ